MSYSCSCEIVGREVVESEDAGRDLSSIVDHRGGNHKPFLDAKLAAPIAVQRVFSDPVVLEFEPHPDADLH